MKIPALLLVLGLPLAVLPVRAASLFTENFTGDTAGAALPATGNWQAVNPGTGTGAVGSATVVQDTSNLFGQGTSNQYLALNDPGSTNNFQLMSKSNTATSVGQFSLQFYQPAGTYSGQGFIVRQGTYTSGNSVCAFAVDIQNGGIYDATGSNVTPGSKLASYSFGAVNSLSFVFNNSTTTYTYAGGTVAAGDMDIWLNGVLVADDVAGTGTVPLDSGTPSLKVFDITAKSGLNSTLYLDNLAIDSVATVPEPSAALLLGAAFLALPLLRRRAARA